MPGPEEYVGVRAPEPASYMAPKVDFSWLGNLYSDIQQAQQNQLDLALKRQALTRGGLELGALQQYFGGLGQPGAYGQGPQATAQPTNMQAGASSDPRGKIPVAVAAANKHGHDPGKFVAMLRSEGLANFNGDYENGNPTSFGASQLHFGGRSKGLGDEFYAETGLDPRDPRNEDAMIEWSAANLGRTGWKPYNGATRIGLRGFDGINRGGMPQVAQGTATSQPAPNEDFPATTQGGPPFAPTTAAAQSTNAGGPQNIRLASTTLRALGPTGVPTAPVNVPPTAPATAAGRDVTPQGQPTQQRVAQANIPPEPEADPQVVAMRRRVQALMDQAQQRARFGALVPAAGKEAENLMGQARMLEEQANQRVQRLNQERQMRLMTGEEKTRGEQAAKTETAKKEEQDQLQYLRDTGEAGLEARGQIGQLNAIAELGEKAPYGGLTRIKQLLAQYGVPTAGLTDIQAYQSAIDFMAPQLRPPGSGRLMANEMAGFKSALGGLLTTPEGRKIAIDNLKLMHQYKIDIGKIARDGSLAPSERMEKIADVPFPRLRTTTQEQRPGQAGAVTGKLPPGNYIWTPEGLRRR